MATLAEVTTPLLSQTVDERARSYFNPDGLTETLDLEGLISSGKVKLVALDTLQKGNGDFSLTTGRSFVYCIIDGTGGLRQASAATQAGFLIAKSSPIVSNAAAGGAIPIGLLITGPLSMLTAACWTLPDACGALKSANDELEMVDLDDKEAMDEAKYGRLIARLGVANHSLYFSMGAAQTATGVVAMLSPESAHLFHYAPILTGKAAVTASMATGIALGAIYVVRGSVMLTRNIIINRQINAFHNELLGKVQDKTLDAPGRIQSAMKFMEDSEKRGASFLKRRVDESCLKQTEKNGTSITYTATKKIISKTVIAPYKDEEEKTAYSKFVGEEVILDEGKLIGKYTAEGIQITIVETEAYQNDADRLEYLKRVDKGIYTEKLKTKISMTIAIAMIIGGITAIVISAVFSGGLSLIIVALISAIFFMSMEYIFLTYDSSSLFEKLRNRLYSTPDWIAQLEAKDKDA